MSTLFYGSLNLTEILNAAHAKHSAFTRSEKNNHAYLAIDIWLNDTPDEYGNMLSIKLKSKDKETFNNEGDVYIGNAKKSKQKNIALDPVDVSTDDDLPF
jgi:hypothetical protein